eukprot:COSAG05_NODE_307_length_11680_cov_162.848804_4_plen_56_part_00
MFVFVFAFVFICLLHQLASKCSFLFARRQIKRLEGTIDLLTTAVFTADARARSVD